ncbi:uncharacterized protein BP5553_00559 [Venustampulla echinocandica]|uniref:Uncharacterized protein n=1 Tax=Venustampulla echinocandica TaxID=2656787 RepID=A0A370TYI6_9HELO|nr:uncharacterized protein BP5553_00559 [Venustampulla echinocandica]RDL40580.1 hypothetical protein BP5553_00559 [Venustampulla echinocandica]
MCGHMQIITIHSPKCCLSKSKSKCFATGNIQLDCHETDFKKDECLWCAGKLTTNNCNIRRSDPEHDVLPRPIVLARQRAWLKQETRYWQLIAAEKEAEKIIWEQSPYPQAKSDLVDLISLVTQSDEDTMDNSVRSWDASESDDLSIISDADLSSTTAEKEAEKTMENFLRYLKEESVGGLSKFQEAMQELKDISRVRRRDKEAMNNCLSSGDSSGYPSGTNQTGITRTDISACDNINYKDTKPPNTANTLGGGGGPEFSRQEDEIDMIHKSCRKLPGSEPTTKYSPLLAPTTANVLGASGGPEFSRQEDEIDMVLKSWGKPPGTTPTAKHSAPLGTMDTTLGIKTECDAAPENKSGSFGQTSSKLRIPYMLNYLSDEGYLADSSVSSLDLEDVEELISGSQEMPSKPSFSNPDEDKARDADDKEPDDWAWSADSAPKTNRMTYGLPANPKVGYQAQPAGNGPRDPVSICSFTLKPRPQPVKQEEVIDKEHPTVSSEAIYNADGTMKVEVRVKAGLNYSVSGSEFLLRGL